MSPARSCSGPWRNLLGQRILNVLLALFIWPCVPCTLPYLVLFGLSSPFLVGLGLARAIVADLEIDVRGELVAEVVPVPFKQSDARWQTIGDHDWTPR